MTMYSFRSCALNQTAMDWDGNYGRISRVIRQAQHDKIDFLLLPELCVCGYGCEDAFLHPGLAATALSQVEKLAKETNESTVVLLGLPLMIEETLYNSVGVLVDGVVRGFVLKRHLPQKGVFYEPRWFAPFDGPNLEVECGGVKVPCGDLVFRRGDVLFGLEICQDAWVADRRANQLARAGVNVAFNPSASHFALGKHPKRHDMIRGGARSIDGLYCYVNVLGNDSGNFIYDGDTIFAVPIEALSPTADSDSQSSSEILPKEIAFAIGECFSFAESSSLTISHDVVYREFQPDQPYALISLDEIDRESSSRPRLSTVAEFSCAAASREASNSLPTIEEQGFEQIFQVVTLGLFDYLRKSHSRGFVVSLSGGVDSAVVSYLAAYALKRAWRELDEDQRTTFVRDICPTLSATSLKSITEEEFVSRALTCVYQRTKQSSEQTLQAARSVAQGLSATFLEFDIEELIQGYHNLITTKAPTAELPSELTWDAHDVTLQNIQARVRGPGVWMVANLNGALLLATSNRSEAAVGYATMDGDTCGGLSPIAGLDKPFLRCFLRWLVEKGPRGVGAFNGGAPVIAMAPTAELRPPEYAQTDEKDLMPYEILNSIERLFLSRRGMPLDVFRELRKEYPQHDTHMLNGYVDRFFRLWSRNQWKRERYAPSFHLDERNLDPKSWCRFPILSGGFEYELRQLREANK